MASLFSMTTRRALLGPSLLCSTGPSTSCIVPHATGFASSARSSKVETQPNDMLQLMEAVTEVNDAEGAAQDHSTLLKNLKPRTVISPSRLSPKHLLIPYLPRPDLSRAYPLGPPTKEALRLDPFKRLGIDPLDSPMNPYLRSEFCTSMGKIKGRGKSGLQRSSQRRMGKAVRRARSMGIIPTFGISLPSQR